MWSPEEIERQRILLSQLIEAATQANQKSSAELLAKFRVATRFDQQEFADFVGVDIRSVKKWESPEEKPPPLVKLNTWMRLFHGQGTLPTYTDLLPELADGNLTGVFLRKGIMAKMEAAEKVWALRAHGKFRAGATEYMLKFFMEKFQKEPAFELHCAWLEHGEREYEAEHFPNRDTQNSFFDMYQSIKEKIPEPKLYGYSLSPERASQCGLSNSPASILLIKYKESVSKQILRHKDIFIEIPVAIYHEQTRTLMEAPEDRWIQLNREAAYKLCQNVGITEAKGVGRLKKEDVEREIRNLDETRKRGFSEKRDPYDPPVQR